MRQYADYADDRAGDIMTGIILAVILAVVSSAFLIGSCAQSAAADEPEYSAIPVLYGSVMCGVSYRAMGFHPQKAARACFDQPFSTLEEAGTAFIGEYMADRGEPPYLPIPADYFHRNVVAALVACGYDSRPASPTDLELVAAVKRGVEACAGMTDTEAATRGARLRAKLLGEGGA